MKTEKEMADDARNVIAKRAHDKATKARIRNDARYRARDKQIVDEEMATIKAARDAYAQGDLQALLILAKRKAR